MCDALTLLEDGIELEKYGEIYAAPKLNVFVLSCLRCQNPYMQLQDFLWHIQWEHAEVTRASGDSGHEAATVKREPAEQPTATDEANGMQPVSTKSNVPTPAVIFNKNTIGAEDSVIAAKRITLSDLGDVDTVPEGAVAEKAEVTSDVVEMTPESDEETFEEVEVIDIEPEIIDITSDDVDIKPFVSEHLPQNESHMAVGHILLPEPVEALNDASTNAVNSKQLTSTSVVNDSIFQMKTAPRECVPQPTTAVKTAKAVNPYRPHSALKMRSLADIKKLLRERFKQQSREKKREELFTCKCCKKIFCSRKILLMHTQFCRVIS